MSDTTIIATSAVPELRTPLTREQTLDLLTKCTRLRAIAYAMSCPGNVIDREVIGQWPESLNEWSARAVEVVLRHREDILGRQALAS